MKDNLHLFVRGQSCCNSTPFTIDFMTDVLISQSGIMTIACALGDEFIPDVLFVATEPA